MPYAKISKPPAHANKNTGSAGNLVEYLEKENIGKELTDREMFFDPFNNNILGDEVTFNIDNNRKGLKDSETKFYEMSVSFSEKEMAHINSLHNDPKQKQEAIQGYVRNVMDDYAKHFDRTIDGKPMEGKDLVYYGKIEQDRRYHPDTKDTKLQDTYKHNYKVRSAIHKTEDPKLKERFKTQYLRDSNNTVILPGNTKAGDNTHVHVIVSRRDRTQKMSLSPLANNRKGHNTLNGKQVKIGFDRDKFAEKVEKTFDKTFDYSRGINDMYRQRQITKSLSQGQARFAQLVRNPDRMAENLAKELVTKMVKRGVAGYLKSQGMSNLIGPINKNLQTNQAKMIQLATQHLKKELTKTMAAKVSIKAIASSIPTPVGAVVKAITIAHSLIQSQVKAKGIERGGRE